MTEQFGAKIAVISEIRSALVHFVVPPCIERFRRKHRRFLAASRITRDIHYASASAYSSGQNSGLVNGPFKNLLRQ
jgi:hypothetical protein